MDADKMVLGLKTTM